MYNLQPKTKDFLELEIQTRIGNVAGPNMGMIHPSNITYAEQLLLRYAVRSPREIPEKQVLISKSSVVEGLLNLGIQIPYDPNRTTISVQYMDAIKSLVFQGTLLSRYEAAHITHLLILDMLQQSNSLFAIDCLKLREDDKDLSLKLERLYNEGRERKSFLMDAIDDLIAAKFAWGYPGE